LNKRIDTIPQVATLDAPTSVTATANADTTINIDITDASPDSQTDGYRIYRKVTANAEYALIADIDAGLTDSPHYLDNGASLVHGTSYDYVASAVNRTVGGESPVTASNSATADDSTAPVFSGTPTAVGELGRCVIEWPASTSNDVDYYDVSCTHTKAGAISTRDLGNFQATQAIDWNLTATIALFTYFDYTVTAVDYNGNTTALSAISVQVKDYLPSDGSAPAAPTSNSGADAFPAAVADEDGRILITWDANTEADLAGYELERSDDAGTTWESIVTMFNTTDEAYTDSGLLPEIVSSTQYRYRLYAFDNAGNRSSASTATADISSVDTTGPAGPTVTATQEQGFIQLTWADAASVARYHVYADINVGGGGAPSAWATRIGTVSGQLNGSALTMVYDHLDVIIADAYSYKLKAEDHWGNIGALSVTASSIISPLNYINSADLSTFTPPTAGTVVDSIGVAGYIGGVRTFFLDSATGDTTLGQVAASKANIFWDATDGKLRGRVNTTTYFLLDIDGSLTLGLTTAEHVLIESTGITMKNGSANLMTLTSSGSVIKIGDSTAGYYTQITPTALTMLDDSANELLSITGGVAVVGLTTGTSGNVQMTGSTINIRQGTTPFITLSLDTSAPYMRIEESGGGKYWEFRKVYNSNDFYILPETDSLFAFRNSSNAITSFGIDTAEGITHQHMGSTVGMPVRNIVGGTDENYEDNAAIDLITFTLATGQMLYCDLTIISWSPLNTQEAQGVTRWRGIIYKDASGTVYPGTSGLGNILEQNDWREYTKMTGDTVAFANVSGNNYKITLTRNHAGTPSMTRIVFKAEVIGDATALANAQV